MADEQFDSTPASTSRRKPRWLPLVVVALLMGAEGIGVFLLAKAVSPGPSLAQAGGTDGAGALGSEEDNRVYAEVELADCRPSNALSGRFISFHIRVSGLVASAELEHAEQLARRNRARLEDCVNTVIRGAEPKYFNEPKLDTIRRRLKHEFGQVFRDETLIREVLIPHFLQSAPGL